MLAMTRLRLVVALIIAPMLAALLALAAFSSEADADHSWSTYHWAHQSDLMPTLQLGDNVSTTWDSYLATASSSSSYNDWSDSSKLDTTLVAGGTSPKNCRATSGRVEVCSEKYGYNGWLGLAQIWISGGHIVQGVAKMNDSYFNTKTYNKPGWRHLVMCQEVGHTFGLGHTDEDHSNTNLGTCMDYTNNPDGPPTNRYPNDHDYEQLDTVIYAHLDSTTTISSTSAASKMPAAANQIDANNAREWGRLIHTSPDGKLEVWERGLGGNNKLITFVKRP